eukprot:Em0167g4a
MFCHTCVTAFKLGRIKSSNNAATAFVTSGFCNWKDATVAFSKHLQSKSHIEAVEAVITLPKQTKDVGAQLSIAHKAEKKEARDMLQIILSSVRFLARQELALRGDGSDVSSNLTQLLHACKHMHHDNQNEMLELMAHQVLRGILDDTHTSPFLAVMVDETRDQSNKEQLTLVLRWVSDDFTVSEEFVGLYYLSVIDAQSIVDAINNAFLRFQIPFTKLRGQCYDGCSTMAGARAGVAVKIQELEPRAVFTHHALNLAVNDTITKRFETGIAPAEFATSPKDEYRRVFFECFDLAVMSIRSRFDQKGFKTFSNVEQLLFKACKGQNYEEELDFVCNFFTNDFNKIELVAELLTLRTLYGTEVAADEKPSVNSIKTALLALSTMQRKLLGAVVRLFQLFVTLPQAIIQCIA